MNLARFLQIRSAFHPKAVKSDVGDKCHKLMYLIITVNDAASNTFDLVPTSAFEEVGILSSSRFFYATQYNKENPEKIRINFFMLANITNYFIRYIDVYQRNIAEIYI